jgi:CRAL/TRIO domain
MRERMTTKGETTGGHGCDDEDDAAILLLESRLRRMGDAVHEMLVAGGEGGLTHDLLRRWLRARAADVEMAARALEAHAAWRVHWVPDGRIARHAVQCFLDDEELCLQGVDRSGRPVLLVLADRHRPVRNVDAFRRFVIYAMDACVAECRDPQGMMCCVFDMSAFRVADNWDLRAAVTAVGMLQKHYVERMARILVVDAPGVFHTMYALAVRPLLKPALREKIRFIDGREFRAEIDGWCDASVIPNHMGGTGVLRPLQ